MSLANPFSALLEKKDHRSRPSLTETLEQIFEFTLNSEKVKFLYLEEVHRLHETTELDLSLLQYALFERLFMCNEDSELNRSRQNTHARQTRVITYLYTCNERLSAALAQLAPGEENDIRDKIMQNVATAMMQPDLYSGQDIPGEILDIVEHELPNAFQFFVTGSKRAIQEDGNDLSMRAFMLQINSKLHQDVMKSDLVTLRVSLFNFLEAIFTDEVLGEIFIDTSFASPGGGSLIAKSVIGGILNLSVLPKTAVDKCEHFTNPLDMKGNQATEESLWVYLDKHNERISRVFEAALRCSPAVKEKLLAWLAECISGNAARGKISELIDFFANPLPHLTASDAFMMNLTNVLLRLSRPFCDGGKVLRVDPTYCAVHPDERLEKGVQMTDMFEQTCLLPTDGAEEQRPTADKYKFISDCFYMTHRTVDLGFRVVVEKLYRAQKEMMRYESVLNDGQTLSQHSSYVERLREGLTMKALEFLPQKCVLTDPILIDHIFDFVSATCLWLCQVAVHNDFKDTSTYAPLAELPINFPLPEDVPNTLKCIPEFVIENVVVFLVFVKRANPETLKRQSYDKMSPILSFFLIYMGSQRHIKNPHLRARLAEGLECLFLQQKRPNAHTMRMLKEHPHRLQIANSLMEVFVGIETTEFEQKFNYRQPIYTVLDFLWAYPEQVECFRSAAEEAEKNMESTNPPLFLKFVNLLINDSIYLLDEVLSNMAKLKELHQLRESGDWANPGDEIENSRYIGHIGNLVKFENLLGKDTIGTLEKLTSQISAVFTHSTVVDRIASMLNYFLFHLVGPKQKDFKVKNPEEYLFRPADTVLAICRIYINLRASRAFLAAIPRDGRSYTPALFRLAEEVLAKIGGGGALIAGLKEVAAAAAREAETFCEADDALAEAPEHFFDPIMSTVMEDPVVLPSSGQTVDRNTIARHLLSDLTDPFNRSPLTLDQVIPNTELAAEIKKWKQERNIS